MKRKSTRYGRGCPDEGPGEGACWDGKGETGQGNVEGETTTVYC